MALLSYERGSFVNITEGLLWQIEREEGGTEYKAYFKLGTGAWNSAGDVVYRLSLSDFNRDLTGLNATEKANAHKSSAKNTRYWENIVSFVVNERLKDAGIVDFVKIIDVAGHTHYRDRDLLRLFHSQMVLYFKDRSE